MVLRLCQLKSPWIAILILNLLLSCSLQKEREERAVEILRTFPVGWFKVNSRHSLLDSDGNPAPHLFFDTTIDFSLNKQFVNALVVTPEGSPHAYSIDLNSGQRHFSHSFCAHKDIWKSYDHTLNRPPFSVGYIPRVLDQLGQPQKVIIWSKRGYFSKNSLNKFQKIKLVGAFIEQVCPEGNCLGRSNWLSKLVFLGVDAEDDSLNGIRDLDQFKKSIDWVKSKAYIGNMDGHNFIGDTPYPMTKVGELIEFKDAFNYFKKRSILLTDDELTKIQKGCHALYDRILTDVSTIRPEDLPSKTPQDLNEKIKLQKSLREKKIPVGFAQRMGIFTQKYFNQITTCEKFVYHGNINQDSDSFWFLSYIGMFYRLNRDGFFFDCKNGSWQKNTLDENGKPIYNIKRDFANCNEEHIDKAMSYLPNFLASLKSENNFYRFIDYDNHEFGSHQKMYSWVKLKSSRFDCSNDPNTKIINKVRVFPEEIKWKERYIRDINKDMKIIY
jgi:hypothetical protein